MGFGLFGTKTTGSADHIIRFGAALSAPTARLKHVCVASNAANAHPTPNRKLFFMCLFSSCSHTGAAFVFYCLSFVSSSIVRPIASPISRNVSAFS